MDNNELYYLRSINSYLKSIKNNVLFFFWLQIIGIIFGIIIGMGIIAAA